MLDVRRVFQIISLIIAITSMATIVYRYYIARQCTRRILIAPIVYLCHVALYYSVVLLSWEAIDLDHILFGCDLQFHAWSAGVNVHAIITVVFLAYAYWRQQRLKEAAEQWNRFHNTSPL